MSRPEWIPYDPADHAWAPDLSPDKRGSLRWTKAREGDLVCVSPLENDLKGWWLPGAFIAGVTFGDGTSWLHADRAWPTQARAQRDAVELYLVNLDAQIRRGAIARPRPAT